MLYERILKAFYFFQNNIFEWQIYKFHCFPFCFSSFVIQVKTFTFACNLFLMRSTALFVCLLLPFLLAAQKRTATPNPLQRNGGPTTINDSLRTSQFGEGSTSNIT